MMSDHLELVRSTAGADGPGFQLHRMFHAHLRTPDLGHVERWFVRVFGSSSVRLEELVGATTDPLNPAVHSTYTRVADLLIASLDPRCYLRGGIPCYPVADRPRLHAFGWYVDGIDELHGRLGDLGYPIVDERTVAGDGARSSAFWLEPEISGLRYQFLSAAWLPSDPRLADPAGDSPVDGGPLGLVRSAYHTVLTAEPKRAVRLFADVLGGTVIHEGRDEVRGLDSVYLSLADAVFEFAVPDRGSQAHADLPPGIPRDTYHAITFQVRDLDRVAGHLSRQGVRLQSRTERCIVTDSRSGLGVPWGFVAEPVPGDERA